MSHTETYSTDACPTLLISILEKKGKVRDVQYNVQRGVQYEVVAQIDWLARLTCESFISLRPRVLAMNRQASATILFTI